MNKIRLPYYVVINDRGYWQPNGPMRKRGAKPLACGPDGPEAWARAAEANEAWRKRQTVPEPPKVVPGSLAAAFAEYRDTPPWREKAKATREEWLRVWKLVGPAFGACRPSAVTLAQISRFRELVEKNISLREAERCIKIWRALWNVAAALRYCDALSDPSRGLRNHAPPPRSATWTHLEAVKLAKTAWRSGYYGLAALIAASWDTSFSPTDIRSLTTAKYADGAFRIMRIKSARPAIGTLSRPARKVLDAYIAGLGATLTPDAPIFRNRSGAPYSKDTLGDDFRTIRARAFGPAEKRTLADFRRSGVVEAVRGGASDSQIGSKLGNQFQKSAFERKTYAPVDLAAVREADKARKRGRK